MFEDGNVSQSIYHFGPSISTTSKWIAMKICTDVDGAQKMDCNNVGDPFAIYLVPSSSQNFSLSNTYFLTKYL